MAKRLDLFKHDKKDRPKDSYHIWKYNQPKCGNGFKNVNGKCVKVKGKK